MPLLRSDRALRRLVAELARATDEDIEAVLRGLDSHQRVKVAALLARYFGRPALEAPLPDASNSDEIAELAGLSDWLIARLDRHQGGEIPAGRAKGAQAKNSAVSFAITPAAMDALQAAAAALQPVRKPPADMRGRTLMGQLHATLLGRAAAL